MEKTRFPVSRKNNPKSAPKTKVAVQVEQQKSAENNFLA
jgi:hypothetical protein